MSRQALLVGLTSLLLVGAGVAEDTYKIQVRRELKPGDRYQIREIEKSNQKMILTDAAGKVLQKSEEQPDRDETYEETILAKEPGKRPHQVARKYEKVVVKE